MAGSGVIDGGVDAACGQAGRCVQKRGRVMSTREEVRLVWDLLYFNGGSHYDREVVLNTQGKKTVLVLCDMTVK